ncbi:MAG: hypothetical protein ACPGJS_22620 [Flammeovirgaceae bacterium]
MSVFILGLSNITQAQSNKGSKKPFNYKKPGTVSKQTSEKNKVGKKKKRKKSKTARKENKGSNKPFNYKRKQTATKQDVNREGTGGKTKRVSPSNKQDRYIPKSQAKTKKPTTKQEGFGAKVKDRSKTPSTKHQNFSMKSSDRSKVPTNKQDDFAAKSKNRQKSPSTPQNKHGVGMIKKPRSEKNRQPIDLTKTKVKVPVVNYHKTDLHRIRHQEKLKIARVPARKNQAPTDKTYMVKVKRTHDNGGLPNRNPVEWSLKRYESKSHKNPRPEISKYHGDFKRPTKMYAEVLAWKKSRVLLNHFGKLNIARPANGRKEYRKLGRKIASWQGDIKVLRRYKHQHPSLRFQEYPQKGKGADVRRNNKKLKKAKYDPNERKIWEPKDDYSTY